MAAIGKLTVLILRFFITGLILAFVVSKLYKWYLLPLGAPVLSMAQLYGIALLLRYVTTQLPTYASIQLENLMLEKAKITRSDWAEFGFGVLFAAMVLLFGWIAHFLL